MAAEEPPKMSFKEIMEKAGASAVRGGTAGACAMGANVAALMWIRTTVRMPKRVAEGMQDGRRGALKLACFFEGV